VALALAPFACEYSAWTTLMHYFRKEQCCKHRPCFNGMADKAAHVHNGGIVVHAKRCALLPLTNPVLGDPVLLLSRIEKHLMCF
jgi:hypothetical protein